jgi:hypothetical protein
MKLTRKDVVEWPRRVEKPGQGIVGEPCTASVKDGSALNPETVVYVDKG